MRLRATRLASAAHGLRAPIPAMSMPFAAAGVVDPRITFTRASGATRTAQNGLLEAVASGVPRIDYDPVTLACRGLLIEETATNLLLQSNGFQTASWSKGAGVSFTADTTAAPDGTVTAGTLTGAVDTGHNGSNLAQAVTVTANTSYTASSYHKTLGATTFGMRLRDGTGSATATPLQTPTSAWQRAQVTHLTAAGASGLSTRIGNANGDVSVAYAQLVAKQFPGSYIPTTTAAATRAADVALMLGSDFSDWFNPVEGTLVIRFASIGAMVANRAALSLSDGTSSNYISIGTRNASTSFGGQVRTGGGAITSFGSFGTADTGVHTAALAYEDGRYSLSFDGATCAEAAYAGVPPLDRLRLGGVTSENVSQYIYFVDYYAQSLTNAQLQALSRNSP